MRYIITFLLAAIPVFVMAQEQQDWRQEAQDMLDEGQVNSALYLLEDTGGRINEILDEFDQVNSMRYLAELYYQAGKPEIAAQWFRSAMQKALVIETPWKRLSAVISVLEMHREAVPDHQGLSALLGMTQKEKLLTVSSKDTQAKEIGRYVLCFDGAATHSDVVKLLDEIRHIDGEWVRKRALLALTKITSIPEERYSTNRTLDPPYDADPYEKFLWQVVLAKTSRVPGAAARYKESVAQARQLINQLPKEKRREAKKLLKSLTL